MVLIDTLVYRRAVWRHASSIQTANGMGLDSLWAAGLSKPIPAVLEMGEIIASQSV